MKILSITSIRSDFDLLSPLYDLFIADSSIEFKLLVSGSHLSHSFGLTVNHIVSKNYPILLEVESLISADTSSSRLKTASVMLISSVDSIKSFSPDLIIITGDREDCLMGAIIGSYLGIPTLHMYGGDHCTDGHVDNPIRHAVSKLSSAHFVSHELHKKRLLCMGETSDRIFTIGSISLDRFSNSAPQASSGSPSIFDNFLCQSNKRALVIYHSLGIDVEDPSYTIDNIISSLVECNYNMVILSTNSDPGHASVLSKYHELSERYSERISLQQSLPNEMFIQLFSSCDILIGNSSAGILEASTFKKPVVNVGLRQTGRIAPDNVVFTSVHKADIISSIKETELISFKSTCDSIVNPYGDGNSAKRALHLIKTINFSTLLRKTSDPLYY